MQNVTLPTMSTRALTALRVVNSPATELMVLGTMYTATTSVMMTNTVAMESTMVFATRVISPMKGGFVLALQTMAVLLAATSPTEDMTAPLLALQAASLVLQVSV